MTPLIRLDNVKKTYFIDDDNTLPVLQGVDLKIDSGEFVAIMGPSGSGKSTLMHMLGFLDRPTSGRYFFDGKNTTNLSDDDLAEIRNEQVGFIFQAFNLLPRTTSMDNVMVPMMYAGKLGAGEMEERAELLLNEVGLGDRMHHEPSRLSGGQQQRVAIARALANDPKIIFADEPTGNLDSKSSLGIMKLFSRLNDRGHTLIFVTHDRGVASYARRTITIKDGKIVSDKES